MNNSNNQNGSGITQKSPQSPYDNKSGNSPQQGSDGYGTGKQTAQTTNGAPKGGQTGAGATSNPNSNTG